MVSIKEVAKHAGVAISTVSKVLNGYPNVSEETKKKVQDAIKELNYIPNSIAAALSSKQFGRIALVLDPNRQTQAIDQIFMQYLVGALDKAKELNVEVVTIFPSMIVGMTAATNFSSAMVCPCKSWQITLVLVPPPSMPATIFML